MSNDKPFFHDQLINGKLVQVPLGSNSSFLLKNILHAHPTLLEAVSKASIQAAGVQVVAQELIAQCDSILFGDTEELPLESKRRLGVFLHLASSCAAAVFAVIAELEKTPKPPSP